MNYALANTQISRKPTGLQIYVRFPRRAGLRGLGQDSSGIIVPSLPSGPSAPSSIDVAGSLSMPDAGSIFSANPPYYSAGNQIFPNQYGALYPLTVTPPGGSPQSTLTNIAQLLTSTAAGAAGSLLQTRQPTAAPSPQPFAGGTMSNINAWLSQPSGVFGLSNQGLVGGALGIGIVVALLGRRR